jgi:hypothetical protein
VFRQWILINGRAQWMRGRLLRWNDFERLPTNDRFVHALRAVANVSRSNRSGSGIGGVDKKMKDKKIARTAIVDTDIHFFVDHLFVLT